MEDKNMVSIPYVVYEGEMARNERNFKRMWIAIIVLAIMVAVTNICWLIYESQFELVESIQIEAEQDGKGTNVIGGGDINYGAESDNNKNGNESQEEQQIITV